MKKRIMALVMAGAMIGTMGLTGCGSKPAAEAPAAEATEATEVSDSVEEAAVSATEEAPVFEDSSVDAPEVGGDFGEGEGGGIPAFLANPVPLSLPPELENIDTVEAEPWMQISATNPGVEGPAFDKEGNLYIVDSSPVVPENHILKITEDQEIETVWAGEDDPNGLAFDADGRLYAACKDGNILAMDADGSNVEVITPTYEGQTLLYNDLIFSPEGNIYATDWKGDVTNPIGGVYMLTKDSGFTEAVPVVTNLASPNGLALSPDGSVMWVGCTLSNNILKISLAGEGVVSPMLGIVPVYTNTGSDGPDSTKTDSAGNVYQAFMPGGRVLVLDCNGVPVENILVPERADGMLTMSTNMIVKPGTTEGYLFTSDFMNGAWIYKFDALAEGK